ncbi:uncharacterized protein F5147DRAFT_642410 [Suillus discolor]|uniref:Uncharacterized protein n=1 Tax=Suillus discolor TaxID=1912936 RepID=A0A9P7JP04_9AGAM|nr:uncharacterized protein F5147DRAFT_642410 [Suillus discolor]KAG2094252.1 hypothetical protein F5147DRAFT_642410 [Suillus discolor]
MPRPPIHCSESHPSTISDDETIRLFLTLNNCSVTKRTNYKLKMVSLKKMKTIRYRMGSAWIRLLLEYESMPNLRSFMAASHSAAQGVDS